MASRISIKHGVALSVYDDRFVHIYLALGRSAEIARASDVEYVNGQWVAVARETKQVIASGQSRDEVIRAEVAYLERGL